MSAPNSTAQQRPANSDAAIKIEESSLHQQLESIDWASERQLVSSLSKLQELESKIHELRSLLPDRLLAPLSPIVNPRRNSPSNPIPKNPQTLNALLRKSATEGVREVNDFKDLWLSPDMQAIWSRVDEKLAESKGAFPQPSGMWDREYDVLLKQMDEEDKGAKGAKTTSPPSESDRGQVQQSANALSIYGTPTDLEGGGGWKTVVESFQKRNIPDFRIATGKNDSMIIVNLAQAGIIFEIQEVLTTATSTTTTTASGTTSSSIIQSAKAPTTTTSPSGTSTKQSLPDWRVSVRQALGKSGPSRLETAIVHHLNSRPRKWDLHYVLELILSYNKIRSTPCKKCNQMTDSFAQLPIVRKPVIANTRSGDTVDDKQQSSTDITGNTTGGSSSASANAGKEAEVVWEAYHAECA